jgi:hypothetical protein
MLLFFFSIEEIYFRLIAILFVLFCSLELVEKKKTKKQQQQMIMKNKSNRNTVI